MRLPSIAKTRTPTTETRENTRFRHADGKRLIEVRVKSPTQLFDARDPAPFRERDLDDDFVEYIVASVRESPAGLPLRLMIHIEEPETPALAKIAIREAVHSYLAYRIELLHGDIKEYIKRAQLFLLIGLLMLAVCIGVAQGIKVPVPPGLPGIFREGLIILGWVSVWKPMEVVLFDWYPLVEKLHLYKKLLEADIDIKFSMKC